MHRSRLYLPAAKASIGQALVQYPGQTGAGNGQVHPDRPEPDPRSVARDDDEVVSPHHPDAGQACGTLEVDAAVWIW